MSSCDILTTGAFFSCKGRVMGGVRFALGVLNGGPEGGRCRRDAAFCGVLGQRRVRFLSSRCLFGSSLWQRGLRAPRLGCVCGRRWVAASYVSPPDDVLWPSTA